MDVLELFSGTKSWTEPYQKDKGWAVQTVDIDYKLRPTLVRDILTWDYKKELQNVDVIYSSPPCNLYFTNIKTPKGIRQIDEEGFKMSRALVDKTIEIIGYFKPKFWLIENPQGKMRYCYPFIFHKMYRTIDYCMYGLPYKKPTDIWSNMEFEVRRCNHKKHAQAIRAHNWNEESYYKKTYLKRSVHRGRIAPEFPAQLYQYVNAQIIKATTQR